MSFDLSSFNVTNSSESTNTESIYVMSNDKYSNLNQMANFPVASQSGIGTGTDKFLESVTNIDFNFDYTQVPMNYDSKSFWEELSEPVVEGGAYVWDTAAGTWESVKTGVSAIGDKVSNVVDSAGQSVTNFYTSLMDQLKSNLIFVVVVLLIIVWVLAKSGLLVQLAAFLKP